MIAAAWLAVTGPCRADDLPPAALVREACVKADAIVEGSIASIETPHNWPATRTEFRINRVHRGPLRTGEVVTYYSSREAGSLKVGDQLLLFLVRRADPAGVPKWFTAIDFAEYATSPPLERRVRTCARAKG